MQTLGVPYPEGYDRQAVDDLMAQAQTISDDLKESGIDLAPEKQMIAMIAYMHKLGKDISAMPDTKQVELHAEVTEESPVPAAQKEITLLESKADLDAGQKLWDANCVVCHGKDGAGFATFPSLIDDEWLHGNKPADVFKQISEGNVAKGMVPYKNMLSEKQIKQLTSHVLITLQK
jgi:cytochrome c oxidase cbb3-type subunit I/II